MSESGGLDGLAPMLLEAGRIPLGLLPVLAFLASLVWLESFKLLSRRFIFWLLIAGAGAAGASFYLNGWVAAALDLDKSSLSRIAAPIVEETLKASVVVILILRNRVGFLVDAAICGFAVGAGFAAVENTYYFKYLSDAPIPVWLIRGFGTAIMHGGATSLMAVVSKSLTERFGSKRVDLLLPGLLMATAIHAVFNRFYLSPILSTLILLVGLPAVFGLVFRVSNEATQSWLRVEFDTDQDLLHMINEGRIAETRVGRYLEALRSRFPDETVFDMYFLIGLHLELSIQAKGMLMMKKEGFSVSKDPRFESRYRELRHLEKSIGKTGLIALRPVFSMSSRDLWQIHMLRRS